MSKTNIEYLHLQDVDFLCSDGPILCSDGKNFTVLGPWDRKNRYIDYMRVLQTPFRKLCRLRFLNPDRSTAFAVDNSTKKRRGQAYITDGSISVNFQNGRRRTASVTLANYGSDFQYNVNNIWFGQEIALDEGLVLADGTDFYIQQGVFLIDTPSEEILPNSRTMTYNLVDKWANLDGTLFGNLEGTYEVAVGTNIFEPISALLSEDRGNGRPLDGIKPIYTEYYNQRTQELPDGSTVKMTDLPYTVRKDGGSDKKADVILELAGAVNAVVGYDELGALRIDPSQDDILDDTKPVIWQFSEKETTLLGMTYEVKNTEVYNDYIIYGEQLDDYSQPRGRAQNLDPKSDTNVNLIGRKTIRESAPGYVTNKQCEDRAAWELKRATILKKAVTISCSQILHIQENRLISIVRTDKEGSPVERHLILGFSRPLTANGEMTINAVSVHDFPVATITDTEEE